MKKLRELLQSKFEEINNLDVIAEDTEDILEKGITRFTYKIYKNYVNSDLDKNYTYRISIVGYIERIRNDEENTLEILDDVSNKIEDKMKELNIKSSFTDITMTDNYKKILVQGEVMYNEINNGLL